MKGLSAKAVKSIEKIIEDKFNTVSLRFLGLIPNLSKQKRIVFSTTKNNLMSLFFQALGTRDPNVTEEQTLKTIMKIASSYVDSLRQKTIARTLNNVDSYVRDRSNKKEPVDPSEISNIVTKEMKTAQDNIKMIVNSESNKAVNVGTALQINKMAEQKKEKDPTVFFIVTIDERNDPETYRLHLLPDKLTPRVWKLSELGTNYHKKGDPTPKIQGTNPNCRCKLSYLSPGWGFKNGKVAFKSLDWDEFEYQRSNFDMPKDLS